jgi:hypothetical protein
VNLSAADLLSYLRSHQVEGLLSTGTGGSVTGPNQPTVNSLEFDPVHATGGNPDLQFSVVSAGPRTSWLRVDGQTIWYPARPADETAPTTGTVIISITSGPTRTVIDPAVVHRLATEFNRLLRTTPGKSSGVACSSDERTLSISFIEHGAPTPGLTASRSGCSSGWGVRGPSGDLPALQDGGSLLTDALQVLGVSPTALYLPTPTPIPTAGG